MPPLESATTSCAAGRPGSRERSPVRKRISENPGGSRSSSRCLTSLDRPCGRVGRQMRGTLPLYESWGRPADRVSSLSAPAPFPVRHPHVRRPGHGRRVATHRPRRGRYSACAGRRLGSRRDGLDLVRCATAVSDGVGPACRHALIRGERAGRCHPALSGQRSVRARYLPNDVRRHTAMGDGDRRHAGPGTGFDGAAGLVGLATTYHHPALASEPAGSAPFQEEGQS